MARPARKSRPPERLNEEIEALEEALRRFLLAVYAVCGEHREMLQERFAYAADVLFEHKQTALDTRRAVKFLDTMVETLDVTDWADRRWREARQDKREQRHIRKLMPNGAYMELLYGGKGEMEPGAA